MRCTFWDLCPREHTRFIFTNMPTSSLKSLDEDILTMVILVSNILHTLLIPIECYSCSYLDRGKHPIIQPRFDFLKSTYESFVSDKETYTPPCHIVRFGESKRLNSYIFSTLYFHNRWCFIPTKSYIPIGNITDNIKSFLFCHSD